MIKFLRKLKSKLYFFLHRSEVKDLANQLEQQPFPFEHVAYTKAPLDPNAPFVLVGPPKEKYGE